ncbi:MAG TPA: hypothetical protein VHO26_13855 [Propionibacteriaceae bacterium]|nr:hypothetical protein [Propionibacteriaceae bacterium]
MSEQLSPTLAAFVAARSAAVISTAIADLSHPPSSELRHAVHRHAGTLATFAVPGSERLARLDADLRAGRDEASVRRDLADVVAALAGQLGGHQPGTGSRP